MPKRKDRRNLAPIRKNTTQRNLNKDVGEERQAQIEAREHALDETLAATFPASDPLSSDPDPAPEKSVRKQDKLAS